MENTVTILLAMVFAAFLLCLMIVFLFLCYSALADKEDIIEKHKKIFLCMAFSGLSAGSILLAALAILPEGSTDGPAFNVIAAVMFGAMAIAFIAMMVLVLRKGKIQM